MEAIAYYQLALLKSRKNSLFYMLGTVRQEEKKLGTRCYAIFWVEDVNAYDLARFGPLLENHPIFPEKANISLAQVVSRSHIILKVWERGVGLTRACGSAACAAAVAAVRKDLTSRHVRISLPGGDLHIEWRASDDHVLMTGPVELEFEGRFAAQTFAGLEG